MTNELSLVVFLVRMSKDIKRFSEIRHVVSLWTAIKGQC